MVLTLCAVAVFFFVLLCRLFLSSNMQVMKLGVLRVIAQKIPALLKALCKGGLARYGSVAKTIVAMNERIRHFGRLIMASLVSPGYVQLTSCCSCFFRHIS